MAYLHRLIFCAVVLLSAWLPTSSYADYPATATQVAGTCTVAPCLEYGAAYQSWLPTGQQACQSFMDYANVQWQPNPIYDLASFGASDKSCYFRIKATGGWAAPIYITARSRSPDPAFITVYSCPSGGVLSGSTCVAANDPYCGSKSGSTAPFSAPFPSGSLLSGTAYTNLCEPIPVSVTQTSPGCAISVYYDLGVPGVTKTGTGTYSGKGCTPGTGDGSASATAPPPAAAPVSGSTSSSSGPAVNLCPPNSFPGTVNGLAVCAPASGQNVVMAGPTKTASSAGGSTAAPTSGLGADAPPTATGSTSAVSCVNSVCTTTTSYTNSSSSVVGTSTKVQPVAAFCTENPNAAICINSSYSATACGSASACSGDAIQCAIAAQAKLTACALSPPASAESALYDSSKSLAGNQTTNLPGNSTVSIGSGSFDQTDLIGNAAGLSNLTVSVMGNAMTLDFTQLNLWLSRLGSLLMVVTFLLCIRIVSRG